MAACGYGARRGLNLAPDLTWGDQVDPYGTT